jgi:(4-(4-[2-(gamma-L-glutamylamino)ethyl]phenoxymethyl)furan-2-yl)methanamine synthase
MSATILALDIGGANLKVAHTSGAIRSVPFALWKEPDGLAAAIRDLVADLPPFDRVALTMTGELCDCFRTKAEGVAHIQRAVKTAFPGRQLHVWGTDGRLHTLIYAHVRWELVAASNWFALAMLAARYATGAALLIDVGSTTADLIPLHDGEPVPKGLSDTDRLRHGELVYAGVKRTPVCALATALPHRGQLTGLAAELFATTQDVYLTLGDLPEDAGDTSTADGRPATREFARDRLARMVCADRATFSDDDARAFAREADAALIDRLVESANRVARESLGGPPRSIIVSGSGEFLAARVAARVVEPGGPVLRLSDVWGRAASDAACAYALLTLAAEAD